LFHTSIYERDCTSLQCFFYKGCTQSNQQVVLIRLMHSIQVAVALYFHTKRLEEDQHKWLQ
jgi:hypothetical protein